ncbi:EamA family transporter, partial [Aequitasia blattaphilus]
MTAFLSLCGALAFDRIQILKDIRLDAWLVIIYLALFCTCLAYFFQNKALTHLPSSEVSMLQCTQPIFTAIISFLLVTCSHHLNAIILKWGLPVQYSQWNKYLQAIPV